METNADVLFIDCRTDDVVRVEIPPGADVIQAIAQRLAVDPASIRFTVRGKYAPKMHGLSIWVGETEHVGFLEC